MGFAQLLDTRLSRCTLYGRPRRRHCLGAIRGMGFYQLCIVGVVIEHHPLKIKHAISPAANRLRPTSCKILIIALLLTYLYIAFSALCFS